MRIEVVYAQLEDQRHIDLELVEGADVAACLALLNQHPMSKDLRLDDLATGVFGEVCDASIRHRQVSCHCKDIDLTARQRLLGLVLLVR